MGRPQKYFTEEQKRAARVKKAQRWQAKQREGKKGDALAEVVVIERKWKFGDPPLIGKGEMLDNTGEHDQRTQADMRRAGVRMNEVAKARLRREGSSRSGVEAVHVEHTGVLAQLADIKARKAAREERKKGVEVDTSGW